MIITGGKYKGRKIQSPDEKITRPTLSKVRQGLFNTLYSLIGDFEGLTFLDLFGGSGVIGLEALSRGFKRVVVYEKNPKVAQIIKKNYEQLGLKPDLKIGDSLKLLSKFENNFDVIYIDPPYFSGVYEESFRLLNSGLIIAEHSELINTEGFIVLKEKNYGGKKLTFIKKNEC